MAEYEYVTRANELLDAISASEVEDARHTILTAHVCLMEASKDDVGYAQCAKRITCLGIAYGVKEVIEHVVRVRIAKAARKGALFEFEVDPVKRKAVHILMKHDPADDPFPVASDVVTAIEASYAEILEKRRSLPVFKHSEWFDDFHNQVEILMKRHDIQRQEAVTMLEVYFQPDCE